MLWLTSNRASIWFEIFNSQSSPRQIYNKTTITPNAHLIRRSEFREVLSEFRICSYANFHPQLCFKIFHFPWLFMLWNINHRNKNLFLPPTPTCRTPRTSKTTAKIDPPKTKRRSEKLLASPRNKKWNMAMSMAMCKDFTPRHATHLQHSLVVSSSLVAPRVMARATT